MKRFKVRRLAVAGREVKGLAATRRAAWLISVLLTLLSACAPAATDVSSEPALYAAPFDAVFNATLEIIAADPAVPAYSPGGVNNYRRGPSTPWLVTVSDREAGLIVAEARSRAAGFVGSSAPPDVHTLNVRLERVGETRTQVSARGTPYTRRFLGRLEAALTKQFGQ